MVNLCNGRWRRFCTPLFFGRQRITALHYNLVHYSRNLARAASLYTTGMQSRPSEPRVPCWPVVRPSRACPYNPMGGPGPSDRIRAIGRTQLRDDWRSSDPRLRVAAPSSEGPARARLPGVRPCAQGQFPALWRLPPLYGGGAPVGLARSPSLTGTARQSNST